MPSGLSSRRTTARSSNPPDKQRDQQTAERQEYVGRYIVKRLNSVMPNIFHPESDPNDSAQSEPSTIATAILITVSCGATCPAHLSDRICRFRSLILSMTGMPQTAAQRRAWTRAWCRASGRTQTAGSRTPDADRPQAEDRK